ncbi:MAG TPA: glycosyltransferase [Thermoanaerobaculia bacterium]
MRPQWESGLRGKVYARLRRAIPIGWRRALRRRVRPERILGIQKPPVDIRPLPLDPGVSQSGRADILVLPVVAWSYRRQRPQQLTEALARRGRRVFYGSLAGSGEPEEPVGAAPGVTLLPIDGIRREDPSDRRLDARPLEKALAGIAAARERFDLQRVVQFVESPYWGPLALVLRDRFGWPIVYDCLDAHAEFSTNRPGVLADAEKSLAPAADLIVATSESLRQRMAEWNPVSRLLPNACDFELFGSLPAPSPSPGWLTVGYVGAVDEWFDMALLERLASLRPKWQFEIVGGMEDVALEVPRLSNVVFYGEVPYLDLPRLRARFDVEIIPFRLSPLTHATDPVKLYEAAAAGRTIVATPMYSLEPLARRKLVRLADTPEEFAREIEAAVAAGPENVRRLRDFGRQNTWDIRAATLEDWMEEIGDWRLPIGD